MSFTYNDEGIRTSKNANGVKHSYSLNGSQIIMEDMGGSVLVYLYDASGSPIGMQYRNTLYDMGAYDNFWFEKNLQGDIVAVYNAAGTKLISYTYDAWGNFTTTYHNGCTASHNANLNPFRYRGYYYDSETGFYYLQSRYYDPVIGRFINADTYVSTGQGMIGNNMFAYCGNNPVNRIDPTGEKFVDWLKDKWNGFTNWCQSTFGAGVVQSNSYDDFSMETLLGDIETGLSDSYTMYGDVSKPVSVFVQNASDWWKLTEYKGGIQFNIGDGGLCFAGGLGETSLSFSFGNGTTVEFMSGINKIGITVSKGADFGSHTVDSYVHAYIRSGPTLMLALGLIYAPGVATSLVAAISGAH